MAARAGENGAEYFDLDDDDQEQIVPAVSYDDGDQEQIVPAVSYDDYFFGLTAIPNPLAGLRMGKLGFLDYDAPGSWIIASGSWIRDCEL